MLTFDRSLSQQPFNDLSGLLFAEQNGMADKSDACSWSTHVGHETFEGLSLILKMRPTLNAVITHEMK